MPWCSTSSNARTTYFRSKRARCIRRCNGCSKQSSSGPSGRFRLRPTGACGSTRSLRPVCATSSARSPASTACWKASRWCSGPRGVRRIPEEGSRMSWFKQIFRRRHLYDELGEELREHIEEKIEQLMRLENLSRGEARLAALRAFGNPALVETRSREVWQWSTLESVVTDLKMAFRRLGKSLGFAVTV